MTPRFLPPNTGFLLVPLLSLSALGQLDSAEAQHPASISIATGSGSFSIAGGPGHRGDSITVYYHRPQNFTPESPILIVVPGAGRNGWDYRDAWVDAANEYGVLVLAPSYPEADYDFAAYHLGGVVAETNVLELVEAREHSSQVFLDEARAVFELNPRKEEWIFGDFDRLFALATSAVGSSRSRYDLFGHSAGGQVLHRLVLFHPIETADRILAANSGFYTMPDLHTDVPFGLRGAPVSEQDLRVSFRQPLTLLLGGEDDHPESGGTFLRSSSADAQGNGRLQRGRFFYQQGRTRAEELGAKFGWKLEIVPGVGHDYRGMSRAAAEYLYGDGTR